MTPTSSSQPPENNLYQAFASSPLLSAFSSNEIEEIYAIGHPRRVVKNEVVFERGDAGGSMFVILNGRLEVRFSANLDPKILETGDFVGELALVSPLHQRTGTAVALEDADLQVFDQNAFQSLLETKPKLLVELLRWISGYLLTSEQRLTTGLKEKNRELERTVDSLRRTFEELDRQEVLARTDDLTGLFNRRSLNLETERLIAQADESGRSLALLILDLDHFKEINDTHGHGNGDEALKAVAGILRANVRKIDLPCRLGGDEFAVLMPDIDQEMAQQRADEIRRRIARHRFELRGTDTVLSLSVSVGGALRRRGESVEEFFERADRGLYASKSGGRNRVQWASEI